MFTQPIDQSFASDCSVLASILVKIELKGSICKLLSKILKTTVAIFLI